MTTVTESYQNRYDWRGIYSGFRPGWEVDGEFYSDLSRIPLAQDAEIQLRQPVPGVESPLLVRMSFAEFCDSATRRTKVINALNKENQ